MTDQERFRYRLTFHKTDAMRFTGHLDLYRALERTIRRAGLPLAYRGGFSPHPRLHLASALPLGFTSRFELADVWLELCVDAPEVLRRLEAAAPPGLRFVEARLVAATEPALQEQITGATFAVTVNRLEGDDLADRVGRLLSSPAIMRERRGKSYDLRPMIASLEVRGPAELVMELSARQAATGRPDEVLDALGVDPLGARIERIGVTFASSA
jgi:radical SAM-linked protein